MKKIIFIICMLVSNISYATVSNCVFFNGKNVFHGGGMALQALANNGKLTGKFSYQFPNGRTATAAIKGICRDRYVAFSWREKGFVGHFEATLSYNKWTIFSILGVNAQINDKYVQVEVMR